MAGESQHPECNASVTGKCGMHDVEVERRRSGDKNVDELKESLNDLSKDIGRLYSRNSKFNAFIAQAKIVGIVGLSIYAASFFYTYTANLAIMQENNKMHREYNEVERRIDFMEGQQLVDNEKFIRLIERMDGTNSRLTEMIERLPVKMVDNAKIQ